jgi:hypothetical protein
MDPLQYVTEAAGLREWEMSLQLAAPHVRRDVAADARTACSGIPDQQHQGAGRSHHQVTCPLAIARRKPDCHIRITIAKGPLLSRLDAGRPGSGHAA